MLFFFIDGHCVHHYRQECIMITMQAVPVASVSMKSAEALAVQQAAEAAEYQRLQAELQTWCQGTALACLLATFIFYSKVGSWRAEHGQSFVLHLLRHPLQGCPTSSHCCGVQLPQQKFHLLALHTGACTWLLTAIGVRRQFVTGNQLPPALMCCHLSKDPLCSIPDAHDAIRGNCGYLIASVSVQSCRDWALTQPRTALGAMRNSKC